MIIDSHTHIFPEEVVKNRDSFCQKDEGFSAIYGNPKARLAGVESLIASMDEAEVDASIICGFPWSKPGLCHLHNQYLLESVSRYPHRLIAFLSLPLLDPDESMKELEDGIRRGARGVGEMAFYEREMTSHDLDLMKPILTVMEERGYPCSFIRTKPSAIRTPEKERPRSIVSLNWLVLVRSFPLFSAIGVGDFYFMNSCLRWRRR